MIIYQWDIRYDAEHEVVSIEVTPIEFGPDDVWPEDYWIHETREIYHSTSRP